MTTRKLSERPSARKLEAWHGGAPAPSGAPPPPPSAPTLGSSLLASKYELLMELASGGMARVVVARRVGAGGFERLVVIKEIHRHLLHEPGFADYFRDEARIASLIHHANVVSVIDVIEGANELVLVMEYVESVALSMLRRTAIEAGEPLPADIVSRIMLDMLAGLQAAHDLVDHDGRALHVIHRDVSPQNLIVGVDGVSRLIDFGVAKAAHRITQTETGDVKGKYAYMSPEQASGGELDQRTDIFAAGLMLYEALAGRRPYESANALDALRRLLDEPLPDLAGIPSIPVALHETITKALHRDREMRFASAAELADALERQLPPASHRKVAEYVASTCRSLLARRSTLLDQARKQLKERASSRDVAPSDDARTVVDDMTEGNATASPRVPVRNRKTSVVLVLAVLGLVGVTAWSVSHRDAKERAEANAAPVAVPERPSMPSSSLQPAAPTLAENVVLDITADAPIRAVRASGLQEVKLEGRTAHLVLKRWSGELLLDADLDGKRSARAIVAEGLTRAVLVTTRTPAAVPRRELQDDPYGQ